MFNECTFLISLNLFNFNNNNVNNMFCEYISLISLNLPNYNTNNIKEMI